MLAICALVASAPAQDILTYHNNNVRNGLNSNETTLTLANVNTASFGKLFTIPTDGLVDAQPLYVSKLAISGVTHNLLIVATEHGSVYAFDPDTGATIRADHHAEIRRNQFRCPGLQSGYPPKSESPPLQ